MSHAHPESAAPGSQVSKHALSPKAPMAPSMAPRCSGAEDQARLRSPTWDPTREAGLRRLSEFVPRAGAEYARTRNHSYGPSDLSNVSALSPWLRHRLILETDVLEAVLDVHAPDTAEKFIQEVFWRGYFKGWLEHRPQVWQRYRDNLAAQLGQLESDPDLAERYRAAVQGRTGIDCMDSWAKELVSTGYLHNHARMWFASIWIFTLRLPWELGADFFYRHLLDGDPASNTCSWRWVGGLHTAGKTYLARASNIARYTEGRFNPEGQLVSHADPLQEPALPAPRALPVSREVPAGRTGLLLTEEDCAPETLPLHQRPASLLALTAPTPRSAQPTGSLAEAFAPAAVRDASSRVAVHHSAPCHTTDDPEWAPRLSDWVRHADLDAIVTARLPTGPVRDRVMQASENLSVPLVEITRSHDSAAWPHTRGGFFKLKRAIPQLLNQLQLADTSG